MKVAIIGAGPAGMFCANKLENCQVSVYEKNSKVGVKLNITGKGRCNITNDCNCEEFLENVVTNPRFLYSAIRSFNCQDTIAFFESNGLQLVTERGRRVFPLSGKATDVSACIYNQCKKKGVDFVFEDVKDIKQSETGFIVNTDKTSKEFDKVVLCCGGVSYPETGSDGFGYKAAKKFGHTIVEPTSALVPIETNEDVSSLAFLDLKNVSIKAIDGKKVYEEFGEVEFFKKGLCGPTVLSISSRINKSQLDKIKLMLDLKPALSKETLENRILREFAKKENKTVQDVAKTLLPSKMIDYYLSYAKVPFDKKVDRVTKEERKSLINSLKSMEFTVKKLADITRGIVTNGGISTKEINPSSMQSKIINGLYFAGEIIDVDALTGGYNIQIALSTANLVAQDINKQSKEK